MNVHVQALFSKEAEKEPTHYTDTLMRFGGIICGIVRAHLNEHLKEVVLVS